MALAIIAKRVEDVADTSYHGIPLGAFPLGPGNAYQMRAGDYTGPLAAEGLDPRANVNESIDDSAEIVAALWRMPNLKLSPGSNIALNGGDYGANIYKNTGDFALVDVVHYDHRASQANKRALTYQVPIEDGDIGFTKNNTPTTGTDLAVTFWEWTDTSKRVWDFWKVRIRDVTVKAAITTNVDLAQTWPPTIQGATVAVKDRFLLTGQTNGIENGMYVVQSTGVMQRVRPPATVVAAQALINSTVGAVAAGATAVTFTTYVPPDDNYVLGRGANAEPVVVTACPTVAPFAAILSAPLTNAHATADWFFFPVNSDKALGPDLARKTGQVGTRLVELKGQLDPAQNGYYGWPSSVNGVLSRFDDVTMDANDDWNGVWPRNTWDLPIVVTGGTHAGEVWKLDTHAPANITAPLVYSQWVGRPASKACWLTSNPGYDPNLGTNVSGQFPNSGGASASGDMNFFACLSYAEGRAAKDIALRIAAGETGLTYRGLIQHAFTLGFPSPAHFAVYSWPASRSDGSILSAGETYKNRPVMYGQRFRMVPAAFGAYNPDTMPGLHHLERAIYWSMIDYGFLPNEKAGTIGIGTERGTAIKDFLVDPWGDIFTPVGSTKGTPTYAILNHLPAGTGANYEVLPRHWGRDGVDTTPDYFRSYVTLDRSQTTAPYASPQRIRPVDPSRHKVIVRNIGTIAVQVTTGTGNNADYNNPSATQWTAGTVVQPGEEVEFTSTAALFARANDSTATTGYRIGVYTELGAL